MLSAGAGSRQDVCRCRLSGGSLMRAVRPTVDAGRSRVMAPSSTMRRQSAAKSSWTSRKTSLTAGSSYVRVGRRRWRGTPREPDTMQVYAMRTRSSDVSCCVPLTSTPRFGSMRSLQFSHGRTEHGGQHRGDRNDDLPGPRRACCLHKGVRHRGIPPASPAPGTLVGVRPIGLDC